MGPPAPWTAMESPVKPANDEGCFGGHAPPPVTPWRWGGRKRRCANA